MSDDDPESRVSALLVERKQLRDALERIADGDGCYTRSYADCCDMACRDIAREALKGC